mmetsp:Transcript_35691/g.55725  ORF Transcript_35691/g.55725 Transcript_35691/m.55725 type:complete len:95 (-) Transcript_35691:740-1024(-)|eukprot:CAMPEP_0184304778 /NCGR_PEP_ID=MMETSP1049-20130417/14211_1 /TAXON_ID=77928 /ORGANISM="Proteomonas sulcata, Strain CCMP704" /LENGTH=94 /DNA_ID=CAMNT_0026616667 /DNA_START=38 /DNA_END=325 /DNA_ORIENTATION=-
MGLQGLNLKLQGLGIRPWESGEELLGEMSSGVLGLGGKVEEFEVWQSRFGLTFWGRGGSRFRSGAPQGEYPQAIGQAASSRGRTGLSELSSSSS